MEQTKICTNCKARKELDDFGKSKRTKDERQQQCKTCTNLKKAILNLKRVIPDHNENDVKICSNCKLEKLVTSFSGCLSNPDGKMYDCKECRKRFHKPKKEGIKIFTDKKERVCTKCENIKSFSEFNTTTKTVYGVISICKQCCSIARKLVKERNKDIPELKICSRCKSEKPIKSFVKDLSKSDGISCVCKPCTNKQRVDRCSSDPTFKLANNVRKAITSSFINCVKGRYTKNSKTENIIKITSHEFRSKIESQFLNWMSWDNYGKYNANINYGFDLDHIIPISYAKTEEEIYLLNHWSNFQPLCSKVNRDIKKAVLYPCTNLELRITFWEDYYEYV